MKVIIAGSRSIEDMCIIERAVDVAMKFWDTHVSDIAEVVSGGATGVDELGECFATENNIPVRQFLPYWKKYGKAAGIIRNNKMADYADRLIAVWDGESKGTKHMISAMQCLNKEVVIHQEIGRR